MSRFTVMGFTEAEIGFVVATLFAAVAVATLNDRDARASEVDDRTAVIEAQRDTVADLAARLDSALAKNEALRDSLAEARGRSGQTPRCWELGEGSDAPIAEIAVLGGDTFRHQGDVLDINGIRSRFSDFIDRGRGLGCVFIVRAPPTPGVDSPEQSRGVWQLRNYFSVDDRP